MEKESKESENIAKIYAEQQWSQLENKQNGLINFQPGTFALKQSDFVLAALNQKENTQGPNDVLMSMTNKSLDKYYPTLAFHLIIKTIKDSTNTKDRWSALTAFLIGMQRINSSCINYAELAVPPFLDLIQNTSDHSRVDLLETLGNSIVYLKRNIEPYLDCILKLVVQNLNVDQNDHRLISALINLIQSISVSVSIAAYTYFSQILIFLLKHLKIELYSADFKNNNSMVNIKKILNILRLSVENLQKAYLNIILSQLLEHLNMQDSNVCSEYVRLEIMFTIYSLAKKLDSSYKCTLAIFQGFAKVLEKNLSILPQPLVNFMSRLYHHLFFSKCEFSKLSELDSSSSICWSLFMSSNSEAKSTNEVLNILKLDVLILEALYLLSQKMDNDFVFIAPMFNRFFFKNENSLPILGIFKTENFEFKVSSKENKVSSSIIF